MAAPHLPALRRGKSYESLDQLPVVDYRRRSPLAFLSQVNAGIIRKDLAKMAEGRSVLKDFSVAQLLEICSRAGDYFFNATLPLGDKGQTQSAQEYLETVSATSGLPQVLVRRNMMKVRHALKEMRTVLNGLTRGLDLSILDRGYGEQNGCRLSFFPVTKALGLVMPSNSPAVNSLWLPAIPLKVPVVLKPGRDEPWTPFRLIQAFIAAGCPSAAFGFYPTDHEGAAEILRGCGRALLFGDSRTTQPYADDPRIQIHGPGLSKILVGRDQLERWPEFLETMVSSIIENGGRSCVNASAVVVPKFGDEIAEALAARLGPIGPARPEDETAKLSGFANAALAEQIDRNIEDGLKTPGALEITAQFRGGPRLVHFEGGVYLRPTIVRCQSFDHPLANREFLFPYASVLEVPQEEMLQKIGPSLAVTAITRDARWIEALLESPLIERLNTGPISTMQISWDQPHEGNMFEFLYRRRPLERAEW